VEAALNCIKLKGASDKRKAKTDIDQADAFLDTYRKGYGYDHYAADQVDKKLRHDHPIIKMIN